MSEPKPLTPDQRRIAALLASGRQQREVAEEVGVSPKTVQRLAARDDFKSLVRRHREELIPADGVQTAEGVLIEGLSAVTASGRPSWGVRIAAAKALLSTPVTGPGAEGQAREVVRETRVYLPDPDDGLTLEEDDEEVEAP